MAQDLVGARRVLSIHVTLAGLIPGILHDREKPSTPGPSLCKPVTVMVLSKGREGGKDKGEVRKEGRGASHILSCCTPGTLANSAVNKA